MRATSFIFNRQHFSDNGNGDLLRGFTANIHANGRINCFQLLMGKTL